ncbi:hypothetical protein T492DRAFT_1100081 [Pavlovales sp. CCMP2436]|nr:hypothetical protein T492DRAFT_1100081 [Pavlovales sp. CCMP2436]
MYIPRMASIFSSSPRSPTRRAQRARWSAGHGTHSTARPRPSKREACNRREAAGMSPIERIEHLEYLEKRWIDLACASSPLHAHRRARTPREGAPRGRA